jgi:hypothetical protein
MQYTLDEMSKKSLPASYAATAAKFIAEERNMKFNQMNFEPVKRHGNKLLTVEQINNLTQEILTTSK